MMWRYPSACKRWDPMHRKADNHCSNFFKHISPQISSFRVRQGGPMYPFVIALKCSKIPIPTESQAHVCSYVSTHNYRLPVKCVSVVFFLCDIRHFYLYVTYFVFCGISNAGCDPYVYTASWPSQVWPSGRWPMCQLYSWLVLVVFEPRGGVASGLEVHQRLR